MQKLLLITGASEGIGAETALIAAQKGYTVCVNYRQNHEGANAIVSKIQAAGGTALAVQADISDEDQVIRMFSQIDQTASPVTHLVNNAGIIESQQKFIDFTADRLHKVFATNVFGSFYCAREAIKRMSPKYGGAGGSIVNLSSVASRIGAPFEYIDYAASKGAIDTMTMGLAKEVAEENIRVNCVRPGIIYTAIHGKAGEIGRVDRLKGNIPMKRGGQPQEIAHAILWLLSDEASYITGTILDVAGGR